MFHVVLVEPEIPPNTGNAARLCLAADADLHLVKPLGFSINDRQLRRAGLDYWKDVRVHVWENLEELMSNKAPEAPAWFLTTKTTRPYYETSLQPGDYLIFGRETKGLPENLLAANEDRLLTIPMSSKTRSLNLATAVGIVLFEGMRQVRTQS